MERFIGSHGEQDQGLDKIELNREAWERAVLFEACITPIQILSSEPDFSFPQITLNGLPGKAMDTLHELYEIERMLVDQQLDPSQPPQDYIDVKHSFFQNLSREIKKGGIQYLLGNLVDALEQNWEYLPDTARKILNVDVTCLYLFVGSYDRFLVGIKDGVHWKKVRWPSANDGQGTIILESAYPFIGNLRLIGRRELIVVPENFIHPERLHTLNIPKPARATAELMESAYYNQRYTFPLEGAEVRLRKCGDIDSMVVIQSKRNIFAKARTPYGEAIIRLNLDTLGWFGPDSYQYRPDGMEVEGDPLWVNVLAEVYHDLVIAVEKPKGRESKKKASAEEGVELKGRLGAVYIPRILRVGERRDRSPYDGPPRPVSPHKVGGHKRRGNMTEKQRLAVMEFEKKYDIEILKNLPGGHTYVKPFVVPTGVNLDGLPVFIKKKIQTELVESLQR